MASSKIFFPIRKPIGSDGNPVVEPERIVYTRGLWSNASGELSTFYTSSLQSSSSKQYYYEVWNSASLSCDEGKMFSVAYGHRLGSGSLSQGGEAGDTPTKAVYSQYRLMCLDPGETRFQLADGNYLDDIYIVNFNRDKVGDKLDPGNFQLNIAVMDTGFGPAGTGEVIELIDDSSDATDSLGYGGIPSPVRNLVSGSIANGVYLPNTPQYYGLVYADTGTIILSADVLDASGSFGTNVTSNVNGNNAFKLFNAISGAAAPSINKPFIARAVDIKEQDFYFVRVENGLCNYSNNPTYVSGSDGFLSNSKFEHEPTSYITSIGLYDDFGQLLAVAKLSQPIKKNFNSELSITVKLEY